MLLERPAVPLASSSASVLPGSSLKSQHSCSRKHLSYITRNHKHTNGTQAQSPIKQLHPTATSKSCGEGSKV